MVRLLLISVVFFFGNQAMSADCGKFRVVKGNVTFKKKSKDSFKKARINKDICQGDTVKTQADSRAKIVMADQNEINISPDSEMIIEDYKGGQKAVLNVIKGKVRSNVKQKYNDTSASHYRVKTKSAVAGVRGTEFMASFNPRTNETKVVTFEGTVNVGQLKGGKIIGRVSVKPGQYTSNRVGKNPHPAKEVPPQELAQMDRESNISDTGAGEKAPASTPDQSDDQGDDADDAGEPKPERKPKPKREGAKGPDGEGPPPNKDGDRAANGDGSDGIVGNGNPGDAPDGDGIAGAPGVDGDDAYREDDQYGDPNFEEGGGEPVAGDGGPGGRDVASVDGAEGGGGDILLPPPELDLPDTGPESIPVLPTNPDILANPTNLPPPCLTCNDAIINQKVRVTIVPVLPGGS